ncbi:hypothetical protein GCK72_008757 [Caenorhabditis remanei]|uniref:Uncharacterized protein n=1 Tax=Caenorhabditis remanei TaxID=31234 RepID=A0A2P4VQY3_CAERE|nr:hypothetical protein GCK72_008757 [Caenorhabditis remanei]KAF1760508.1 hypothetical protein GCK72_008757 [Caenorhabditis remanei]
MSQRLLVYRLVELYRDQDDVNKEETLCFNLNTRGINQRGKAPYLEVDAQESFNYELIFPTYDGTAAYCTLVINPIGANGGKRI